MARKGCILVIDDEEEWCEHIVEKLQNAGFYVEAVSNKADALKRLDKTFFHLLILDIRLDESDQSNEDGIHLLQELEMRGLGEATKVIMLSNYGTIDQVRMALVKHRNKVADFLSKNHQMFLEKDRFTNQELLATVQAVFTEHVKFNPDLEIHWQSVQEPEQAVLNLDVRGTRIKKGMPLQSLIAVELDDLLCRLFYQATSILIQPLIPGFSGTNVLAVQPSYPNIGAARTVVVKYGNVQKIEAEHYNFKHFVEPFVGGARNTTVQVVRRTQHLGGLIYSFLGATSDRLQDFSKFYHQSDISQIKVILDCLFLDTCKPWYANMSQLRFHDLSRDYQQLLGFTWEELERTLSSKQFKTVQLLQGKQKLSFSSLTDHIFTNPLLATMGKSPLVRPTYTCITHGDCNQHNFFVDGSGHVWLIDFQGTSQGHILRDIAMLDSTIRFQLLASEEDATLKERFVMEELLCTVKQFSHVQQLRPDFPTQNQALAKAYAAVVHLRTLAYELVKRKPNDDISEYYIALLYNALNAIRFSSLSSLQREHALLSASLLVDQL